jgi:hypothetical protein
MVGPEPDGPVLPGGFVRQPLTALEMDDVWRNHRRPAPKASQSRPTRASVWSARISPLRSSLLGVRPSAFSLAVGLAAGDDRRADTQGSAVRSGESRVPLGSTRSRDQEHDRHGSPRRAHPRGHAGQDSLFRRSPPTGAGLGTIATIDTLQYARQHHSTSLLLPSGKIMVTGGSSTTIEVFSPPYLFDSFGAPLPESARPDITAFPDPALGTIVLHGSTFTIGTSNAASIDRVVMVKPMAVTHQTDTEQR